MDIIKDIESRVGLALTGIPDPILVGLSGGADSVALTLILHRLGREITAVNCNFHLRGEESDRDSIYCEELCSRLGISFIRKDYDVASHIRSHGGSVEMACRDLRYSDFYKIGDSLEVSRIAVAHNADDQVETVLMNLFRGGGVAGLRGMKSDTGKVIRPLLGVSRSEIEDYLNALGIAYMTDSTNLENIYRRNFVRHELLPMIEKRWPEARKRIRQTAAIMETEEKALQELAKIMETDRNFISKNSLAECFDQGWVVRRFVIGKGGSETIAKEISDCLSKGEWKSGRHWHVPGGDFATSPHGLEWISSEETAEREKGENSIEGMFEVTEYTLTDTLLDEIKQDKTNLAFWTSESPDNLKLRHPEPGDRIRPLGMSGSRKVSDVISDAKLTASGKLSIVVAQRLNDGEILWVEGLKRSRMGLIGPQNKIIRKIVRKKEN